MDEDRIREIFREETIRVLGDYSNIPLEVENAFRRRLNQPIFASKQHDFGSIGDNNNSTFSIDVIGAESGDPVVLGIPSSNENAGMFYTAWVSSSGVVTVRLSNESGSSVDLPSGLYQVAVLKK